MTTTAEIFCPTQFVATGSATELVLAPSATTYVVKQCSFANVTGTDAQLTLYRVPSAGSGASSNVMLPGITVSANQTYLAQELDNLVLAAGDSLWAQASAASAITITVSGFALT